LWSETTSLVRDAAAASGQGLDQIGIWACLEGGWRLTSSRGRGILEAGGFAVIDLAEPMEMFPISREGQDVVFWGPRLGFGREGAELMLANGGIFPPNGGRVGLLNCAFAWSGARMNVATPSEFGDVMGLLTGLSTAALTSGDSRADALRGRRATPLARARAFIDAHLKSRELNPEMIAGTVGVSRARLYRLFEPYGGISLYIRRRRLGRLYADLQRLEYSDVPTARLALSWGFGSASAFEKAFTQTYGITPAAHRRGTTSAIARLDTKAEAPSMSDLIRLIL